MSEMDEVAQLRQEITSLHQDCQDLASFITAARSEIAEIRPNDLKQEKLPRAGKELDAIVEATETATNQIMNATESIMSAKVTDADVVNDAAKGDSEENDDASLLNGPALDGEGVNQQDIDTMFDEESAESRQTSAKQEKPSKSENNKAQDEIDALFD